MWSRASDEVPSGQPCERKTDGGGRETHKDRAEAVHGCYERSLLLNEARRLETRGAEGRVAAEQTRSDDRCPDVVEHSRGSEPDNWRATSSRSTAASATSA